MLRGEILRAPYPNPDPDPDPDPNPDPDLGLQMRGGEREHGLALVVQDARLGATGQQQLHHLVAAARRRVEQRRLAVAVQPCRPRAEVAPEVEQALDVGKRAAPARMVQRRAAALVRIAVDDLRARAPVVFGEELVEQA